MSDAAASTDMSTFCGLPQQAQDKGLLNPERFLSHLLQILDPDLTFEVFTIIIVVTICFSL